MEEQSLALSFSNSLTEEVSGIVGEYAEIGLDALVEDGLLKDIPIVSTAVAIYRIGKSIRERHHIAKLIAFLNEINKGIDDEEKRRNYRDKFAANEKFRNQELEYILILIDRYINQDKARMLAKLYLAYLSDRINWDEFVSFAEIVDRLLPDDVKTMMIADHGIYVMYGRSGAEPVARLCALGLMVEETNQQLIRASGPPMSIALPQGFNHLVLDKRYYAKTDSGKLLANILR